MNKLNLCKILKGHEGETFYSRAFGNVKLNIILDSELSIKTNVIENNISYDSEGRIYGCEGEQDLFPAKNQRNWEKWNEENNYKIPKTWSKIIVNKHSPEFRSSLSVFHDGNYQNYHYEEDCGNSLIEKSALALLKIHQLIEIGYGGNITNKEWINDNWKYVIGYHVDEEEFPIMSMCHDKSLIAFHTREQAKEFLSYPENVELLRDYYMI